MGNVSCNFWLLLHNLAATSQMIQETYTQLLRCWRRSMLECSVLKQNRCHQYATISTIEINYCIVDCCGHTICRYWQDGYSPAYVFEATATRFERLQHNPYSCAEERNRPSNNKNDDPENSVDWVGCHDRDMFTVDEIVVGVGDKQRLYWSSYTYQE